MLALRLVGLAALVLAIVPGSLASAARLAAPSFERRHPGMVGLGATLTTSDGGQIFGFDIDQNGTDGVLASSQTIDSHGDLLVSMQTFDQNSGAITKTFARYKGTVNSYGVDGIAAGDVSWGASTTR